MGIPFKSVAILVASMAAAASAQTLFDSGGFESSAGYNSGTSGAPISGQPGGAGSFEVDVAPQSANPNDPPVVNPTVTIQSYTSPGPTSGSQYAYVQDSSISGDGEVFAYPTNYDAPNSPFTPDPSAGTGTVNVFWTMRYTYAAGEPFFGVQVYDGLGLLATGGVDAQTGTLIVDQNASDGGSGGVTSKAGVFYQYELSLDYGDKQYALYRAPVNSNAFSLIGSAQFITPGDSQFTDADLVSFVRQKDGGDVSTGDAIYDNFSVVAVPEPVSASLVAAGGMVLIGRRRRR